MVQLKYFGDKYDYFKYDLITEVFKHTSLHNYVYIPMLTQHRDDREGKTLPANPGGKSEELLRYIADCKTKSLKHWQTWLNQHVESYNTIEPVDSTLFSDNKRDGYWNAYRSVLKEKKALVFVDPDTGLESGSLSYQLKQGREKYLLKNELDILLSELDPSSVLMLYQHLLRDKDQHHSGTERKLSQARTRSRAVHACAYREGDLAFLFISKQPDMHSEIKQLLMAYHSSSGHIFKSIHL
jgi:hypothetical protein